MRLAAIILLAAVSVAQSAIPMGFRDPAFLDRLNAARASVVPVDPYDNLLVLIEHDGTSNGIPNPTGDYDLTYGGDYAYVHCHNAPGLTGLNFEGTALTNIDLVGCNNIGVLNLANCAAMENIDLRYMTNIGSLMASYCSSLTNVDLRSLVSANTIEFGVCEALQEPPRLDSLEQLTGYLGFWGCISLKSLSAPLLWTCQDLVLVGCHTVTNLYLPSLFEVTGILYLNVNVDSSIELPQLYQCGQMGNSFYEEWYPMGVSMIYIPNFNGQYTTFIGFNGSYIESFYAPNMTTTADVIIPDANLNQTSVDWILISAIMAGKDSGTINLSGGNNSPPSDMAYVTDLQTAGVTVGVNSP
jgi:hypothetical protein